MIKRRLIISSFYIQFQNSTDQIGGMNFPPPDSTREASSGAKLKKKKKKKSTHGHRRTGGGMFARHSIPLLAKLSIPVDSERKNVSRFVARDSG